jgi:hypothetical protein
VGGRERKFNHREPGAAAPQAKFGVFLAKALRRKGFKKRTVFLTSRLCVLARGISESEKSSAQEKFAQAAKIVVYLDSNTKVTNEFALESEDWPQKAQWF